MISRSIARILFALLALGIACAIVTFVLVFRTLERHAREGAERTRADFRAYHAAFLDDRDRLASHPAFQGIGRLADAGSFLNDRIRWSLPDTSAPSPSDAPLALPKEVTDWLSANFRDAVGPPPPHVAKHDATWLSQLHRYDHWDIGKSPHHAAIEGYDLFTGPMPYYLDLMGWAKLRALQALSTGDVAAAHRDIVHLARLALSTETVLGGMIAVAILTTDRTLYERVQRMADHSALDGWEPFSIEDSQRAQRALFASLAYFAPFTPAEYWGGDGIENVLDCIGVQEGLAGMHRLRPILQPVIPERYIAAERLLAEARGACIFSRLHQAWGAQPAVPPDEGCHEAATAAFVDFCIKVRLVQYAPGLGGAAARALQGGPVDPNTGFGRYQSGP